MLKDFKNIIKMVNWCKPNLMIKLSVATIILVLIYVLLLVAFDVSSINIINFINNF